MFVFIWLFCVTIALLLYLDTRKPRNFPPGPKWLPVLGSALAVKQARADAGYFFRAACNLAKRHNSANGVLGLRIGKDLIVITNDLDTAREMLFNEELDGRPDGLFYTTRTFGRRRGIVLTDMDLWRDQRKFIMRHLKEFGYGRRGMFDIVHTETEHLLRDVTEKCRTSANNNAGEHSAIIQMNDLFNVYILNTLWYMMAGIRYSSDDAELKLLQELLFELFANIDMIGALFSHFPLLRFIAPEWSGYSRFLRIHQKIWKFLGHELNRHEKNFNPDNEDRDFMDAYIRVMKSPVKKPFFDDAQLLAVCMDLFMAGTETTSKSMGFAFLNLVRYQDVQKKAQREIDAVIGRNRLPTLDDRSKMPYNEAIVLETVRHFMGRTFGIPHRALRNTKLGGYTVPKDAIVIMNFYGIMMNDALFEDAKSFRPERYIVDGKVVVPDHYIPFGAGKHRCMGELLARSNIFMFIVTLLQSFEFQPVPGEQPPSDDPIVEGATPSVVPFRALVIPRQK